MTTLPFLARNVRYTAEELEVMHEAQDHIAELNERAQAEWEARHHQTAEVIDWEHWRQAHRGRLVLTEADMLVYPKPPVLADGLLIAGTLASLVSEPGLGKSFLALDLALSIASGQPTFVGFPLRIRGPVVYVVGEGAGRFKLRLKAWRQHHGITEPLPFHWTNGPINLLDAAEVDRMVDAVRVVKPLLVVFDTFSRCLVGADENSQASMTEAVAALDRIRTSVDHLTVLVLHHTNASGVRERGSSVFKGAVDTQLRLSRPKRKKDDAGEDDAEDITPGQTIRLSTDKQKDLDSLVRPVTLHKTEIVLTDETEAGGEPSTSLMWMRRDQDLPLRDRMLAFIRRNPNANKNEIAEHVGGRTKAVFDLLVDLESSGLVIVSKHGKQHRVRMADAA